MARKGSHCDCKGNILGSREGLAWRNLHYRHAKLESSAGSSIILAAFGMEVMASYAFTYPTHVPSWLMTLLAVNTVSTISMHCFAFIIGTWLSPYLHATAKEYHSPSDGPLEKVPTFSPHSRFTRFIKISHQISHVVGLFIFLVEIVLIAWVKFWDVSLKACIASTVIVLPFMFAFVFFWWYFNFHYKTQIYENRTDVIDNVEMQYNQMNQNLVAHRPCEDCAQDYDTRGMSNVSRRSSHILRRKSVRSNRYPSF